MGKGLEQTLLRRGHTEGPETYERMLSITSLQREMQIKTTMRYFSSLLSFKNINCEPNSTRTVSKVTALLK